VYARRRATDARFSFGVGKVNALAGFAGALLLAVFAVGMAVESCRRFAAPESIAYDAALLVAAVGLGVNVVSALFLAGAEPAVAHAHGDAAEHGRHGLGHHHPHEHHDDHNLRAAYLHVLADALTSVLAILALLGAKLQGWTWLDPVMGLAGSVLVARWSWGLLRDTSRVLLDHQAAPAELERVRAAVEGTGTDRVVDLHVWSIGPAVRAACLTVVADAPEPPDAYRDRLPPDLGLAHVTVEVHACRLSGAAAPAG
jgi:cation diffusion facilitator family transporter